MPPPAPPGDERGRMLWLLHVIILGSIPIMLAWGFAFGFLSGAIGRTAAQVATFIAWGLLSLGVARRGRVWWGASLGLGGQWLLVTISAATAGGMRSPSYASYAIVVLATGLLFGSRMGFVVAGASLVAGIIMVVADAAGMLRHTTVEWTPAAYWVAWALIIGLSTLLQYVAARLANDALVQERELSRLKDEFLATISHELNTPLTPLLGWLGVLADGKVPEEVLRQGLNAMGRSATVLRRVVGDLIDLSQLVAEQLHLDRRPIDLQVTVVGVVAALRPVAVRNKVDLSLNLGGDMTVMGDERRLGQALSNIVSNAIKFTPAGGRVEVGLRCEGDVAEVRVRDTGEGIAPEFLPHVFDRFRQADQSPTRRFEGLGIGLAITKGLITLHGGTVCAASPGPAQGSTFTLRLPVDGAARKAAAVAVRRTSGSPVSPAA